MERVVYISEAFTSNSLGFKEIITEGTDGKEKKSLIFLGF